MTGERIALAVGVLVFVGFATGAYLLVLRGDGSPPGGRVEWSLFEGTGDQLMVTYYGRSCEDGHQAVVEESEERVEITVWVDPVWAMCDASLARYDLPVTLESDLGDREVVDGACLDDAEDAATCVRVEGVDVGP